jgi:hypothetical protein
VLVWIARGTPQGGGTIRCLQTGQVYLMSYVASDGWGPTLRDVVTHSVAQRGAFLDLWVLPNHL